MFPRRKGNPGSGVQRRCSRPGLDLRLSPAACGAFVLITAGVNALAMAERLPALHGALCAVESLQHISSTVVCVDPLSDVEVRVLGSLIEKDITTPDYYPLSLNALVNACNQKNNREPVMTLDEDAVRTALESLQRQRLAGPASGADGRVTKYEHRLQEIFNFDRREIAILCVLLLRGAQTPGELRGRAERMYRFEALDDVVATLDRLSQLLQSDIDHVNTLILERMQSPVALIPQLAGHIIAAGGKRLRPMLTLAASRMCGYRGDRQGVFYNVRFAHLAKLLRLWPKSIRPDPHSSVITDGLSILKPSPMSDGPSGVRSLSRWFSSSAATRSGRGPW